MANYDLKCNQTGWLCRRYPLWFVLIFFLAGQIMLGVFAYSLQGFFGSNPPVAGQRQKDVEYFRQLVAAFPENAEHQTNLGISYFTLGRYRDALRHLRTAKELDEGYLPAYLAAGQVYEALGQKEDALGSFRYVQSISPQYYLGYLYAGKILHELGRYTEAAGELERARALRPADSSIYLQLGLAYESMGEKSAAGDAYQKALSLNPENLMADEALRRLRLLPERTNEDAY